ncbi:hypothetical protein [Umezawaea sp. Da 62-37]|uniref:hypothetical protein n=1 Tax=Umezawaea sp. Da 62-37 TaxID=3075927 RepID=UPI0028F7188F|nr:hypothetical protein [Umezawaea sp. Da 62-37]WNV83632.1 hypothetical protein RM788_36440 [Umezawaea sp. Da 62-37]
MTSSHRRPLRALPDDPSRSSTTHAIPTVEEALMTMRSEPPVPESDAVPASRRDRRAGKKSRIPPRAFSASVANQRQHAVRRRG